MSTFPLITHTKVGLSHNLTFDMVAGNGATVIPDLYGSYILLDALNESVHCNASLLPLVRKFRYHLLYRSNADRHADVTFNEWNMVSARTLHQDAVDVTFPNTGGGLLAVTSSWYTAYKLLVKVGVAIVYQENVAYLAIDHALLEYMR